jgi:hypothetical protein
MNLKTFSLTYMSKCHIVSQCVMSVSFLNWHIFVNIYFVFVGFCVALCYSVTHVMSVSNVTFVTLLTKIKVMCHLLSNLL